MIITYADGLWFNIPNHSCTITDLWLQGVSVVIHRFGYFEDAEYARDRNKYSCLSCPHAWADSAKEKMKGLLVGCSVTRC